MTVIVFPENPQLYHYPALKGQRVTDVMCGKKLAKKDQASIVTMSDAIPNDWEPCPDCAAIDEHEKHFVGRVL